MTSSSAADRQTVTRLLGEIRQGESGSFDRLFPIVYEQLRNLARMQRRSLPGAPATMDTTALVHEAYLKLVDQSQVDWKSRGHFGAVAAVAMRHILIDYARKRTAKKRGGERPKVSLDDIVGGVSEPGSWSLEEAESMVALDRALQRLEEGSPRQARIVELKFFGGLTIDETAEALDVSPATVKRGWRMARAWLYREMGGGEDEA